jgi:hypothetical protein
MVNARQVLKGLSASVAIAAATATGGPAAGASMSAFLSTPTGQRLLDFNIDQAARNTGVQIADLAQGGLVTYPTLGLTGEMGPELVLPVGGMGGMAGMTMKPKRKPSAYNRRYAAAYKRIKKKHTLKSGKMGKGWTGKRGHNRIVKLAHAAARKGGKKK